MMKVILPISQIVGKTGESMEFSLSEQIENTAGYPDVVCFSEPVTIEGVLKNTGKQMVLNAVCCTEAKILCSRCLAEVNVPISFQIEETFYPAGYTEQEKEKEAETFSDDRIDVSGIIERGILAGLPMKVVCREQCKGLCSKCGKNLNEGPCSCDHTEFDPRLESLRSLFNVDEEV